MIDTTPTQLKFLASFQVANPISHVGGSFGLLLHGIRYKELLKSDLDITMPNYPVNFKSRNFTINWSKAKSLTDFDHGLVITTDKGFTFTVDIRISPEPSFVEREYGDYVFNVSRLRDILYWKLIFASKGSRKHQQDLDYIRKNHGKSQHVGKVLEYLDSLKITSLPTSRPENLYTPLEDDLPF